MLISAFLPPAPLFLRASVASSSFVASSVTRLPPPVPVAHCPRAAALPPAPPPTVSAAPPPVLARALAAVKALAATALLAFALLAPHTPALAASAGGRMGGSSFRSAPSRSYSAPSRSYSAPSGSLFSPYQPFSPFAPNFYAPSYSFGGGGVGVIRSGPSLLQVLFWPFFTVSTVVWFRSLSKSSEADGAAFDAPVADPPVSLSVVKVGLLANARSLQMDLDTLARSADTSTAAGLTNVLQDSLMALLRNPDFWAYGSAKVVKKPQSRAEGAYAELALGERLKLDEETLTNASGRRREAGRASAVDTDLEKAPSEYIVVVLLIAASGALVKRMPAVVNSAADLQRALKALATVTADDLQAVEVIWAPQSLRDTLSEAEMLSDHPELRRL